jgi:hypothetical protein
MRPSGPCSFEQDHPVPQRLTIHATILPASSREPIEYGRNGYNPLFPCSSLAKNASVNMAEPKAPEARGVRWAGVVTELASVSFK